MSQTNVRSSKWLGLGCFVLGLVFLATGLFFVIGGGKLLSLGGSPYFLIAGIFILISAIQFFRRKSSAVLIFTLVFVGSALWAVLDAGLNFWPLVSRLMTLAGFLLLAMITLPALRKHEGKPSAAVPAYTLSVIVLIGMVATLVQMFQPHPTVQNGQELPLIPVAKDQQQKNWDNYGNTPGGSRFAALDQITRDNVQDLKVAWIFHTGDTPLSPDGNGAEDQQTPLQVGNTVFLCTPHNNVIAVAADTGKQIWKAEINAKSSVWMRCRGPAYFDVTQPLPQPNTPGSVPPAPVSLPADAACQRRILMNTIDARLMAFDADNGKLCVDFGNSGTVNLREGMGEAKDPGYVLTSAPTLAGSTVVVGGRVADNVSTDMPGGVMRGFDVITGKMRWAFDPGRDDPNVTLNPGEHYTRSTPNSWAAMSYDASMNTVFIPMGSSSVDLWGVNRTLYRSGYRYITQLSRFPWWIKLGQHVDRSEPPLSVC